MVDSRTKHSKRNIFSGLIKQAIHLALTFAIRTLVIYILGAEYQGLSGLFTSILQVISLADLGFSTAVMFVLYKPIADNDKDTICAIVNYLKKIYLFVGIVILLAGLCVLPFIPKLISGDVPAGINVYILFVIYLINASISYILFAYKSTLISAMQCENIVSNVYTITFSLTKVLQIILLLVFRNYYVFIIVLPLGTILNSVCIQIASRKYFPNICPKGKIDQKTKNVFKKQIVPIFLGKIGDVARNSLDNIVISILFGLTLVAIYDNYFYIYSALYGIMGIIINGMMASVGNSIVSESVEKNYNDLLKINFIFMLIVGWCSICMFCLYQPFMNIWMNGDETMMMSEMNMSLFCLYFYFINMTYPRSLYLEGKGLFYETRFWCVFEAVANLCLNFLLGKLLGITGIILATIITIFVFNFCGRSEPLFKKYFVGGRKKFYLQHLLFFLVAISIAFVTNKFCEMLPQTGLACFALRIPICVFVPAFFFVIIYSVLCPNLLKEAFWLVKRVLLHKK